MKHILLSILILLTTQFIHAQDYQYLRVVIDSSFNFAPKEINWYDNGVEYPPAMTAYNAPSPYEVTGDNANWQRHQIYDNDINSHAYVGEVTSSSEDTHEFILDMGLGNSIYPDSMRLGKPAWSNLTSFRVLCSNDLVNWDLFLDTTMTVAFDTLIFPLNIVSDTSPPTTPQNVLATMHTPSQIVLEWDASTDDFLVTQYHIYQNGILIDSTNTTIYGVQNLVFNSNYDFQIIALDKARNESLPSSILSETTLLEDNIPPSDVDCISVQSLSSDVVSINWETATDNQAFNAYLIQLDGVFVGTSDTNSFSFSGLDSLTNYTATVIAKDDAGNLSSPISTNFRTLASNGDMRLGTNFWNQVWSQYDNQLFVNSYLNVTGSNPWKTELIDELGYAKTLRFMEMQQINREPSFVWQERRTKDNIIQDELAYEWMIDLCNRMNANLWVCLPVAAISRNGQVKGRENYIKKLAILLKTGIDMGDLDLDATVFNDLTTFTAKDYLLHGGKWVCEPLAPHLKIYIEYGNENWNWNFPQSIYCMDEGLAMNLSTHLTSANRLFTAYASLLIFQDFETVFGIDAHRIETILPIQTAGTFYMSISITDIFDDLTFNPTGIMPDHISGATYFGNGMDGADPNIIPLLIDEIASDVADNIDLRNALNTMGDQRNHHFGMIAYEGGQHVVTNFAALNANPLIYDTYLHYLDTMQYYFEETVLYSHVATNSFGLKQYIGQPLSDAHKYRAVVDWLPTPMADSLLCQNTFLEINDLPIATSMYKTSDQITSMGIVPTKSIVDFRATNTVDLLPGFCTELGANFSVDTESCIDD